MFCLHVKNSHVVTYIHMIGLVNITACVFFLITEICFMLCPALLCSALFALLCSIVVLRVLTLLHCD